MLENILFVKDYQSENAPGSCNDKFYPSKVPLNHTTRSSSTYQLKVNNFKTETVSFSAVSSSDMIRTYSQMHCTYKYTQQMVDECFG